MKKAPIKNYALRVRPNRDEGVRRTDLQAGDMMLVMTQNSVYTIRKTDQDTLLVSGGWFDRTGQSPVKMTIAGCTWDGKLLDGDLLAARGMRLRFGNNVVTSPIRNVQLLHNAQPNRNRPSAKTPSRAISDGDASTSRTIFPWKQPKKPSS